MSDWEVNTQSLLTLLFLRPSFLFPENAFVNPGRARVMDHGMTSSNPVWRTNEFIGVSHRTTGEGLVTGA